MRWITSAARCDDWNLDVTFDIVDEFEIEAAIRTVLVDTVEHDFSGSHCLNRRNKLTYVDITSFPTPFGIALIPTVLLTLLTRELGLDRMMRRIFWIVDIDFLWMDTYNHGLASVCL